VGIWLIVLVVSVVAVWGVRVLALISRVGAGGGRVADIFLFFILKQKKRELQVWRILIAVGSGRGSRGIATGGSGVGPAGG
jgi:hypothetical protein